MENVRHELEIDKVLETAAFQEHTKINQYPSMTYAQGVDAGIRWILGLTEDHPFDNDSIISLQAAKIFGKL